MLSVLINFSFVRIRNFYISAWIRKLDSTSHRATDTEKKLKHICSDPQFYSHLPWSVNYIELRVILPVRIEFSSTRPDPQLHRAFHHITSTGMINSCHQYRSVSKFPLPMSSSDFCCTTRRATGTDKSFSSNRQIRIYIEFFFYATGTRSFYLIDS
jgi:hypothetical protein